MRRSGVRIPSAPPPRGPVVTTGPFAFPATHPVMMSVRSITAVNRTVCASSAHDNAEHGVLPDRRSATAVDSVDSVRQSPRVIASHNRETYAHLVDHGARPDRVKQGAVLRASASVAP